MADRDYDHDDFLSADGGAGDGTILPDETKKRKPWRKWFKWGFYAFSALFFVTIIWLVVTAPLGRSLEPLEEPALLFVTQEGQPIARRGAIKDEPVEVTKLPAHVTQAFVAIEDRRF